MGKNGEKYFSQVFSTTKFVFLFISKKYVEGKWTKIESKAALDAEANGQNVLVISVRFYDSIVEKLPKSKIYWEASKKSPIEIATNIKKMILGNRSSRDASKCGIYRDIKPGDWLNYFEAGNALLMLNVKSF